MVLLQVQKWLNELCEELSERLVHDMERNKRIARTLTLHASAYKVFRSLIFFFCNILTANKKSLTFTVLEPPGNQVITALEYMLLYGTSHIMCL